MTWTDKAKELSANEAWMCDARRLTLLERIKIGYDLWRCNASRFPWPVKQTNPKNYWK